MGSVSLGNGGLRPAVRADHVFSANFVAESRATPKGSGGRKTLDSPNAHGEPGAVAVGGGVSEHAQEMLAIDVLNKICRGEEDGTFSIGLDDPAQERTQFPHWLEKGIGTLTADHHDYEWWCIRRVVWVQFNGVWRSHGWAWTPYNRTERWYMLSGGILPFANEVVVTTAGHHIPEELLPRVIAFYVDMPLRDLVSYLQTVPGAANIIPAIALPPNFLARDFQGIKDIAQVSRAFFRICAPLLYARIRVDSSDLQDLCKAMRASGGHLRQYVRSVTIKDGMSWTQWPKLARLSSKVLQIHAGRSSAGDGHGRYHASQPYITAISCAGFVNVTSLSIRDSHFATPSDVLRILGGFPNLTSATLDASFSTSRASSRAVIPHKRTSRLRILDLGIKSGTSSASLLGYWSWPHVADAESGYFPGLRHADVSILAELVQAYIPLTRPQLPLRRLRIDRMDGSNEWLLSHLTGTASFLEIYVANTPNTHDHPVEKLYAHVRHIVIRVDQEIFFSLRFPPEQKEAGWRRYTGPILEDIDKCLSRFHDVETVTIEIDAENIKLFSRFAESMPLVGAKTRLRSFQEAEKSVSATPVDSTRSQKNGPISPFWYSPEYQANRQEQRGYGVPFVLTGPLDEVSLSRLVAAMSIAGSNYDLM